MKLVLTVLIGGVLLLQMVRRGELLTRLVMLHLHGLDSDDGR